MKRKIAELSGGVLVDIKKHRRARHMRITVHRDGHVLLTLPWYTTFQSGVRFLHAKKDWIIRERRKLLAKGPPLLPQGNAKEFAKNKERAKALIEERLRYFQRFYGVQWEKVRIGNQKSRWGSCSRTGTLSFTYRLVFLPPHLLDYVIVHEICHLLEFNHSPRFWKLVGRTFPDYSRLRRELRLL